MQVIDSFRGCYWFLSNFYPCDVVYDNINFTKNILGQILMRVGRELNG
jgi:hypothetical protein